MQKRLKEMEWGEVFEWEFDFPSVNLPPLLWILLADRSRRRVVVGRNKRPLNNNELKSCHRITAKKLSLLPAAAA